MELFFAHYYPQAALKVHAIGAVCYLSDTRVIDLVGLADREVAELKRQQSCSAKAVQDLVVRRSARLAIVYNEWFTDGHITRDSIPKTSKKQAAGS
jgi:hypothetical protein